MTGVAIAFFANDMTGVDFAGLLPPFSGKNRIMVWDILEWANLAFSIAYVDGDVRR
jgi:hypothetical protein